MKNFELLDWLVFAAIFGILIALGVVGEADYNQAVEANRHHCKMVALWESSNGENGHPNFDKRECSAD